MSDLYIALLETSYSTTDNSIFSSSARVEQKCCCELFLVKLVLRVVRHGLEFTAALDSHEICFLFHKIWVMHFSLPAARFNLFVKIEERCLYFQSSIGTGYSKKLYSFLSLEAFKTEKMKPLVTWPNALAFSRKSGCKPPDICYNMNYVIPYSDFSYKIFYEIILQFWGSRGRKSIYSLNSTLWKGKDSCANRQSIQLVSEIMLQTEFPL